MRIRFYKLAAVLSMCVLLAGCRDKGPSEVELARNEGISYMEQADYQNAITAFENAYNLCDEKMPETKTDISLYEAACQFKTADFEGVKNTCSRILELGENADAYYMRGAAFLKLGEPELAKADFDAASLLTPEDYGLFLDIYKQYEEQSQSAVGDEYLQKALNIPNEDMEDYYQKGSIYFYLGDYAKAQEMLSKPAEAKHKEAMMLMGEVYLALDDSVHARNVYQQYIAEYGEEAAAYNGIVLCELADENYDAAVSAAETGLALEGSESAKRDLLYNEIVAYERKHDFETAKAIAAQFMELYPDDAKGKKEYDFLSTR
ncbi:tetratricopeptide repeat protein [Marvinbryantia sp.]|uniref:tetratricopeptide repeat protein n=1 Tax=Marvinbryantia sp. TaxID=2496532 RepID=UPI0026661586|nr:tetratricopeptide repeat protein [uncultured Marvinbryantia sp.]